MRCDRISIAFNEKGGLEIEFADAPFDDGKLHAGKIEISKNGQVVPKKK